MHRWIGIIMAVCLGVLLPAVAMPLRVCLLDPVERSQDCCDDCSTSKKDCCVDTAGLPASLMPPGQPETLGFVAQAMPPSMVGAPVLDEGLQLPAFQIRIPVGVGPPAARLAVLGVWRL